MLADNDDIYLQAVAVEPKVTGVYVLSSEETIPPEWIEYVITREDGVRIRIDTNDNSLPSTLLINTLMNLDLTDAVVLARKTAAFKTRVITEFLNNTDSTSLVMRSLALVLMDEINVLRAANLVGVATGIWDAPSIANGAGTTSPNLTVTGALIGDIVDVAPPVNPAGLLIQGYVSANNTVTIRLHNGTGGAINLASGTWGVAVRRPRVQAPRTSQELLNAVTAKIQVTS